MSGCKRVKIGPGTRWNRVYIQQEGGSTNVPFYGKLQQGRKRRPGRVVTAGKHREGRGEGGGEGHKSKDEKRLVACGKDGGGRSRQAGRGRRRQEEWQSAMPLKIIACVIVHLLIGTRLPRYIRAMVQQRRRPAGVLHGAPLLLCLALLILATEAVARPAPSDNDHGSISYIAKQRDQQVSHAEEVLLEEKSALLLGGANEDVSVECESLPDSTVGPCGVIDHRMLGDYSPPSVDVNPHPGDPLP